ncbi:hypothetical protein SANTM175S_10566 [Streptomyces antimycoticus]
MTVPDTSASVVRLDGPWTHRDVAANGARFHIAELGDGPLVLLLHGFPQFWWTWRHQLPALADAGYRAVAMDLRGVGGSDRTPRGSTRPVRPRLPEDEAVEVYRRAMRIPSTAHCLIEPYRWMVRSLARPDGFQFNRRMKRPVQVPTLHRRVTDPVMRTRSAAGSGSMSRPPTAGGSSTGSATSRRSPGLHL